MSLEVNLRGRLLFPLHVIMWERSMTMRVPGPAILEHERPVEQRGYCLVPEIYLLVVVAFTDQILLLVL